MPNTCLVCFEAEVQPLPGKLTVLCCPACNQQFKICGNGSRCPLLQKLRQAVPGDRPVPDEPLMLYAASKERTLFGVANTRVAKDEKRCVTCESSKRRDMRRAALPVPSAAAAAEVEAAEREPPAPGQCLGHLLLEDGECSAPATRDGLCGTCSQRFKGQEKDAAKVLVWQLETAFMGTFCNPVHDAQQ